jgi:mRNA interferase MazF
MNQYDVFLISLDPTLGHEIRKVRPCLIISPDEMNRHLQTMIIAPMTSQSHAYPSRVPVRFQKKNGWIVLDQIRAVDKRRLIRKLGSLNQKTIRRVKAVIKEMLVD